jgi:glycosyltransferase involved in cell wall biosynthesis
MRGSDICVHASKHEALSGTLIEAMGYGVPCVATDTGGTAEIVLPDVCGFLVPPQDAAMLADRVVRLVRDESTRRAFAAAARAHFERNFTAGRCAAETAAFFDEIMAARRGGAACAPSSPAFENGVETHHNAPA